MLQGLSMIANLRRPRSFGCFLVLLLILCPVARPQSSLPDAPAPQPDLVAGNGAPPAYPAQNPFPPQAPRRRRIALPGLQPGYIPTPRQCLTQSCSERAPHRFCCQQNPVSFRRYLAENAYQIYTPETLARLAASDVFDPFNLLTIAGTSAYSVALDSHSPYGPGMMGWARYSGVAFTQDMTGEFFGTFLIPSLDGQNPHYFRKPNAPMIRRIAHCIYQPFWTVNDRGGGMVNYAVIAGTIADEAINTAYVPYQRVGWGPSAARIATAWGTDPIGNFITEFVPDVARHLNVKIVLVQRIINQVAIEEGAGTPTPPPP